MSQQRAIDKITDVFNWLIDVGFIWFLAWAIKPDIESDIVWFVAVIYASLLGSIKRDPGKEKG